MLDKRDSAPARAVEAPQAPPSQPRIDRQAALTREPQVVGPLADWLNPTEQVLVIRELNITYHLPVMGICDVDVHFWVEKAGRSSVTYTFEILSADHTVRHAEGTRVIVNLNGQTLRPAPLTDEMWEIARPLLARGFVRPAA